MNVTLYSTNCPKCKVLESKLTQHSVDFNVNHDVELMREKGFDFLPKLEVDGIIYNFKEAVEWIGAQ
jgi:hypothetical protein